MKIWNVQVLRKSDNKLVYGNEGDEIAKVKFEKAIQSYSTDDYNIEWKDVTSDYEYTKLKRIQLIKVKKRLKELSNSNIDSFDNVSIKRLLKAILDILVDRNEMSNEE